jgi:hypothetical protein
MKNIHIRPPFIQSHLLPNIVTLVIPHPNKQTNQSHAIQDPLKHRIIHRIAIAYMVVWGQEEQVAIDEEEWFDYSLELHVDMDAHVVAAAVPQVPRIIILHAVEVVVILLR